MLPGSGEATMQDVKSCNAEVAETTPAFGHAGVATVMESLALWLPPLLCCALFVPCVTYSEWYIDELFAVLRNADARGESSLAEVFSNDFWGNPLHGGKGSWTHKSYRPLSVLSFSGQFWLLGGDLFRPQPLRAFNVALHAANTLLVLALLRHGLDLPRPWARLAACLFAAHPVHAENIIYLVGRADALSTTGWLLAAIAQLQLRKAQRDRGAKLLSSSLLLALCTLLAILSGLCKESGLTLLVFIAAVELVSPCPAPASPRRLGRGALSMAFGALTLFAAVGAVRFWITQGTGAPFGFVDTPVQYQPDRAIRAWSYLFQHAYYAKLLFLPGALSWDYSFDTIPLLRAAWRDARALAVVATYLALFGLAAWSLSGRGRRRLLLGLMQAIIPFVPASNLFFIVGVTVGERLLYPSTVGASIAVAALGYGLERSGSEDQSRSRSGHRRLPLLLGHAFLLFYVWRCGIRVWQWHSSEALYAADAAAWPGSVKTRHQLGTVFHAEGRYAEALVEFEASLAILDDNALTDQCVAQIYIETGRYAEAVKRFEKILSGHGVGFSGFNLWMLYTDYGFALTASGRHEEAIPALQEGLRRNAAVPHAQNALGYSLASFQRLQEAQDALAKGLEHDPDNPILWNNLAVVWMIAGAFQQAAQGLERALQQEPNQPTFLHNALLLQSAVQAGGMERMPRMELFFSKPS